MAWLVVAAHTVPLPVTTATQPQAFPAIAIFVSDFTESECLPALVSLISPKLDLSPHALPLPPNQLSAPLLSPSSGISPSMTNSLLILLEPCELDSTPAPAPASDNASLGFEQPPSSSHGIVLHLLLTPLEISQSASISPHPQRLQ
ncbi:hypothetical protein EDB86DRAFT_3072615 [Lactarius hatsudake]|nr:hypothetical protein EDB86DRAFT_3072615 [Lactarius hatsudake]